MDDGGCAQSKLIPSRKCQRTATLPRLTVISGPVRATGSQPSQASDPLFVVSMWRSGSSLLYALLNKHPDVGLMYEADLILLRSVFLKPRAFCDWTRRWQSWNQGFKRNGLSLALFTASGGFGGAF